ncbi:MAG TPA: trypsin-like peptidase domain-containing protein [Baekduia sp.]
MPRPRRQHLAAVLLAAVVAGCGSGADTHRPVALSSSAAAPASGSEPQPVGDLQQRFISIVRAVSPSVVQIQTPAGLGSGVVYDDKGDIVTNNHVVGGEKAFRVTLSGGDTHPATLVGTFPASDLAVIRLKTGKAPAASFGDSSKVVPGQFALALGNPLGLRSSVTDGVVSSVGRTVGEGNGVVIASAIQTSAPINPGNSGGALVDLTGAVIGVPTLAATDPELGGAQAPGIGFAIPGNTVRLIANQLIATGHVTRSDRAFLGIEAATTVLAPGVVVSSVEKNGPAAKAGIQPGDVILSVAGHPTPTTDDLAAVLATLHPGQSVPVSVLRPNGSRATLTVRLADASGASR